MTPNGPGDDRPDDRGGPHSPPDPEATLAYLGKPAPPEVETEAGAGAGRLGFLEPPRADGEVGWLAHYRVRRTIGEGGMGLVFQAEDTHLLRPVALKVIRPELAGSPVIAARFLAEARAAAAIKHDHIVTIYQVGQDRDVPFIAMEYLEGISLARWIERGRKPSVELVLRIGREVAAGLAAAHAAGLTHRDIKPANIWLEAPSARVKILDFGQAQAGRAGLESGGPGAITGTPAFMSPEQARGAPTDAASDLFSLGGVLYRLLAGRLPFEGTTVLAILAALQSETPPSPRDLDPAVPPELDALVMRLLAKRPEDRPPSAQAVAETIRGLERRLALDRKAAESVTLAPAAAPPRSRRRPILVAFGLAAVAGLTLVLLSARGRPEPTTVPPIEAPADPTPVTKAPPAPIAVAVAAPPATRPPSPSPAKPAAPSTPTPPRVAATPVPPAAPAEDWGTFEDPDSDCTVSIEPRHGRATIVVPGTSHVLSAEIGRVNAPRLLRPIRGDFDARVRVRGTDHPAARGTIGDYVPYHGAGLLLWQDARNYVRLEIATDIRKGKPFHYANFEYRKDGRLVATKGPKIDDESTYVRLERRGGEVRASFGPDGEKWTLFPPLAVDLADPIRVGLAAVNTSSRKLSAEFEGYRVLPVPAPNSP